MDNAEFIQKTNDIAAQIAETTDEETKKKLTDDFFDVAIDMWNDGIAGDVTFADGRTATIRPIEL
jgi:hypothetical protein